MNELDKVREDIAKILCGTLRDPEQLDHKWADEILAHPSILIKADDQSLPVHRWLEHSGKQMMHEHSCIVKDAVSETREDMLNDGWVKTVKEKDNGGSKPNT